MTSNLHTALNQGMTYEKALEVFKALETPEIVEVLNADLNKKRFCNVFVESSSIHIELAFCYSNNLSVEKKSDGYCLCVDMDSDSQIYLNFQTAKLWPNGDYDTTGEDADLYDLKEYCMELYDKAGKIEGIITIEI